MRSLASFCLAISLAAPVYADLSVNDLPYTQGTPLREGSWTILDYSQNEMGLHWVWLQQGASAAYIVYPSEDPTLLPDNTTVPADADQVTLRFSGIDQDYIFTRFGNGLVTAMGDNIEVRYATTESSTDDGIYIGDLDVEAREIHLEGELRVNGSLAMSADEIMGIYGQLFVRDQLSLNAKSNLIVGSLENADGALKMCPGVLNAASVAINIGTPLAQKTCEGDYMVTPDDLEISRENNAVTLNTAPQQSATQTSKGGSNDWWFMALLATATCRRNRRK